MVWQACRPSYHSVEEQLFLQNIEESLRVCFRIPKISKRGIISVFVYRKYRRAIKNVISYTDNIEENKNALFRSPSIYEITEKLSLRYVPYTKSRKKISLRYFQYTKMRKIFLFDICFAIQTKTPCKKGSFQLS